MSPKTDPAEAPKYLLANGLMWLFSVSVLLFMFKTCNEPIKHYLLFLHSDCCQMLALNLSHINA